MIQEQEERIKSLENCSFADDGKEDDRIYIGEKPNVEHCKAIINNKLYDTEKAKRLGIIDRSITNVTVLFKTPNNSFFTCEQFTEQMRKDNDKIAYIISNVRYSHIRPTTEDRIKNWLGENNVDKYVELFGEVEEA